MNELFSDEDDLDLEPLAPRPAPPKSSSSPDRERYISVAKNLVVENYNKHHNPEENGVLRTNDLYVKSFEKIIMNWKVELSSRLPKREMWIVTYDAERKEYFLEYYKRFANVRIPRRRLE